MNLSKMRRATKYDPIFGELENQLKRYIRFQLRGGLNITTHLPNRKRISILSPIE